MKKQHLLYLLLIYQSIAFGQNEFEAGYIIDASNQKIECLIKNNDWKNNPSRIEYKLSATGDAKEINIKKIQEFEIYTKSKYQRFDVKMERSFEKTALLGNDKNPNLSSEQVLLKVLIDGEASLYSYEDTNLKKFFYKKSDAPIEQLVFVKYLTPENRISQNNRYRQQLWNKLQCSSIDKSQIDNIEYKQKEMIKLFVQYNECANAVFKNYVPKRSKQSIQMALRLGAKYSSSNIENAINNTKADFGGKLGLRVGLEASYFLPYRNDTWAIIIEPTYNYYTGEQPYKTFMAFLAHRSIELGIGARHFLFLGANKKIFLNASVVLDISLDGTLRFTGQEGLTTRSKPFGAFGAGLYLADKMNFEIRFQTPHDILRTYNNWISTHNAVSANFGYKLF